jgi:uncharacterized damage-inducible protein DinB
MFCTIEDFKKSWEYEVEATGKIFSALTDKSLEQKIADGYWTLGELAWHIVTAVPEMLNRIGLTLEQPGNYKTFSGKTSEIVSTYKKLTGEAIAQIEKKWNDGNLQEEDDMYGRRWKKGETLHIVIVHQIHHRGQMTVLMRQAGLQVPGVYGPSKDEWSKLGMEQPPV